MNKPSDLLFRQEVIDHSHTHWAGKVTLVSRISAGWVLLFASIFILSLLVFIIFGQYTRRVNVTGEILIYPHPVDVLTTSSGIIEKVLVKPAQQVKKGQVLYQVSGSRFTLKGNVNQKKVAALNQQLLKNEQIIGKLKENKQTTIESLQRQQRAWSDAWRQSRDMLAESLSATKQMKIMLDEYQQYSRSGLITKDQLNNQNYMYQQQKSVYSNLYVQNVNNSLQATNLGSEIGIKSAEFDNQILQIEVQNESLRRELAEAEAGADALVVSPMDGKIESSVVTEGQMVNSGDTVAQVSNDREEAVYAIFWLPDDARPYVMEGNRVNVRFSAFPFEIFGQFTGEIVSVSSVPASLQELSSYKSSPVNRDRTQIAAWYKTVVKFKKDKKDFRARNMNVAGGMKITSTFFLEKRPLYKWMMAPLYKINNSVVGPVDE